MKKLLLILTICLLCLTACGSPEEDENIVYEYTVPDALEDGLEVGHLSDAGMDLAIIEDLIDAGINGPYLGVHSVLILKGGRLVVEEYFRGWQRDQRHDLMSCTKSVTSAVFGIAWDREFIQDVNQRIFTSLPAYTHWDGGLKSQIRIFHLLTMTAGFEWDQDPTDPDNTLARMMNSPDSVEFVLSLPMAHRPGEVWNYCGGGTQLLAAIIKNATGIHADEFVDRYLFGELGITNWEWRKHADGLPNADYGLHMIPRDMIKIGFLFLNRGTWRGQRVISEAWVAESTAAQVAYNDFTDYGYQWRVNSLSGGEYDIGHFCASGNGGQIIAVFPSLEMVVVFTQGFYHRQSLSWDMVTRYILPAVLAGR